MTANTSSMQFELSKAISVLERTPHVLEALLKDLPEEFIFNNEGPGTFSPFDVMGHYLHGEKTDWMARIQIILNDSSEKNFATFDRFAQYEESKGKSLVQLIEEFKLVRKKNIELLRSFSIDAEKLNRTGNHPKFGAVTLRQLLSTWVIHDLTHLAQISRVMAKQLKGEMGPWLEYFRFMQ
jgi:hypothetical protein